MERDFKRLPCPVTSAHVRLFAANQQQIPVSVVPHVLLGPLYIIRLRQFDVVVEFATPAAINENELVLLSSQRRPGSISGVDSEREAMPILQDKIVLVTGAGA